MAFAGLVIRAEVLPPLTADFLDLKQQFFPRAATRRLDHILVEVKGSDLRRHVRSPARRRRRHTIGVLDRVVGLIERYDVRLIGRVWVKAADDALEPRASYTYAIQDMARHFNHFLDQHHASGLILCDGRNRNQDAQVAHSIFTMKHKSPGDELPALMESAVFGRSENHAGLQIADIVVSGLLFPMAARVYCAGQTDGIHVDPAFDELRTRFAARLRSRQHLYRDASGKIRGGVVVSDKLGRQPSRRLFEKPA